MNLEVELSDIRLLFHKYYIFYLSHHELLILARNQVNTCFGAIRFLIDQHT
jgi:hypothetical protein